MEEYSHRKYAYGIQTRRRKALTVFKCLLLLLIFSDHDQLVLKLIMIRKFAIFSIEGNVNYNIRTIYAYDYRVHYLLLAIISIFSFYFSY